VTAFLVVGEALVDVVTSPGAPAVEHAGGSPANVAYGLARLGNHVTLLTNLGADEHGMMVRDHLESAGVAVIAAPSEDATSTAMATISSDGSAAYDFDVTWDVDVSLAPDAEVLHVGSIGATLPPGADEVRLLVTIRRASSLVSFDPNIRPPLLGPRESVVRRVEHLVVMSDIVKVSAEDLDWLYPRISPVLSATRWATIGGPLIVLTDGAHGVTAFWHGARIDVPSERVRVVDTIGAGDTFTAALLDALCHEAALDRDDFSELDAEVIADALHWAAAAAAVTVSRAGAALPTRDEVGLHLAAKGR
jgi:fructokinase